jgi:hypothetical protein
VLIVARRTVDEVKLRGPQLPAQTANSPVRCASAPPRPSRAGRDLALAPQRVGQPIQTVADDAVDTFTPAAARSSANWPATVLAMSALHCPSPAMQDTVRRWTNFHILGPDRNLVQKALEDDNDTRISGHSARRCRRRGCMGALVSRIWHCQNP